MEKKKTLKKQIYLIIAGMVICIALAGVCYRSAKKAIIANEQESLKNLAKVTAQSLESNLEARKKIVNASVPGEMKNIDEIERELLRQEEPRLEELKLKNEGYCIIKAGDGTTIIPDDYEEEDISFSYTKENSCSVVWVYATEDGMPKRTQKLIASESFGVSMEKFVLYIVEDYDKVIRPIERMAFYFVILGIVVILFAMGFISKLGEQKKKEELLVKELQYEKKINESMKEQEGLMQKYNHSKTMSILTNSIAHEFNNLMTPVILYADLLRDNEEVYRAMPEEVTELKSATERCGELAKQLLDYSRLGKAEKVLTNYDATFAVNEAVNIAGKLVPQQIRLTKNICRTSYYVHGQIGAFNQILINLVSNAVRAMKEKGEITIQFGLSTDNNKEVRLVVKDTGEGIDRNIQRYIFQPFFTTSKDGKGMGIGLPVVKQLTEEHGGTIRVRTDKEKGTTFILDFPIMDKEDMSIR